MIRGYPNGATHLCEAQGRIPVWEYGQTRGTETSKYPEEQKITNDSLSSGERTGTSPNRAGYGQRGVVGPQHLIIY